MRTILVGLLLCTAFVAGEGRAQLKAEPTADDIARGKALTDAGDCASCHTADPAKPFAGGKRIDTPFGAHLFAEPDTGSRHRHRRLERGRLLPRAALWRGAERLTLLPGFSLSEFHKTHPPGHSAIRAYLATLTPVKNTPPPPELRWPFNYRVVMRGWNWLFFKPGILQPDQQKSAEWNRGRYLVEGAAHCGACHTPKNIFGADKRGQAYGGGLVQGMFAPRLDSAERSGLKSWSVEDIAEYLQSGRNGRSHAGELMSEVVVNSTSKMSDADIRAIAVYLKDLPAGAPEPTVTPPPPAQMADGEKLYKGACIACHEVDGTGAPRVYPPLPGNANLQSADPSSTLRIILDGAETVTTPRAPNKGSMPAYAENVGSADCRRHELHPQCLGQCRAGGDSRSKSRKRAEQNSCALVSADRR